MSQDRVSDERRLLAHLKDAVIQVMRITYSDLLKLATKPDIWNSKPCYDIDSPWQGSNMQGMFTSIYDIPVEVPPYNKAAFSQLISKYDIELQWETVFIRYDRAYRAALDAVNKHREEKGLTPYPSVEEAQSLPMYRNA